MTFDLTAFSQGLGLVMVGWLAGAIVGIILRVFRSVSMI